jgi:autotransporter-associated beta strand protein
LLPGGNGLAGTLGTGPLTLTSARTVFEFGTNDINNAAANDLVSVTGNLTLQGVTTNTILTGPVGSLTNNQIITLFQFTGTLTGGTNNLRLIAGAGYEFAFLDPATTPGTIQIKVINSPAILTWRGHVAGSQTLWNIQTTTNWLDNGVLSDFLNLDGTIFDDSATSTTVNLTTNLSPSSVTMNNNAVNYTFTGSGRLTGVVPLTLQGSGVLAIANTGSNDFSGPVNINSGTLQVGNGGAGGNLGTGPVTNQSSLVFNRTGALTINGIHGSGSVSNVGSGVVTIGGANTYEGALTISQGTVRAGSGTALGSVLGGTLVANGATLDVNGQVLNLETITVSGHGVGGNGAIVNNGVDQLNAMGSVTLEGHTTFGCSNRWDIRGGAASLSTGGLPYNLIKIGPDQFSLVGVLVDAALADITVQEGIFAAETTTSSLGDPTKTITIAAGATFQLFNSTVAFDKIFLLTGNGVANTINVSSGTGNSLIGPINLTGPGIVNVTAANAFSLPGPGLVTGTGSLAKNNTGTFNVSTALEYSGDTTVNGGALIVSGPAALTNSPVVTVNALLDVTGLNNGPTLERRSGQMLMGNGNINGSVNIAAGATLAPGLSIGVLTVTNNVNLNGTTVMEVQSSPSTNDRLRCITGTITYGGTLVVTNLTPITGTNTYQLFQGALAGSFANVILPSLPGVTWNTANLNVNGTITAFQSVATTPINLAFSLAGSGLDISWPGSHTGWRLEGQTNSVNVGLSNNWVTVAGSATTNRVIVPFNPANGTVFYRLVYP